MEPLAEALKEVFRNVEKVTMTGENAKEAWTQMAIQPESTPDLRKELSHLGALSVDISRLRALALTKTLGTITVEGNTVIGQGVAIFRGSEDMGNVFYAEWLRRNIPDTATWHNDEHKGDIVEAILGAVWIITHAQEAKWAGQKMHIQTQMEAILRALWDELEQKEKKMKKLQAAPKEDRAANQPT